MCTGKDRYSFKVSLNQLLFSRWLEDEKMFNEICRINPNRRKVYIVDARSYIAAVGNKAIGGGYEDLQYYKNCQIVFGDIENIHAVRDAYRKLFSLCENSFQTKDKKNIFAKIESWGWITLLKNILQTSLDIAVKMTVNLQSIVVHCSDGWDRTAQLCSLSQMMIDPYYRTLIGFEVLIEKEWTSFGHKFDSRWGHFKDDNIAPDERSPIFIQFLDCVYQIIRQFPTAFQFNDKLLLFLAHHVYTWKYGTFLWDNERSRFKDDNLKAKTTSIWTYVNDNWYDFINPFYVHGKTSFIKPSWDYLSLEFWKEHFLVWSDFSQYLQEDSFISANEHKEEFMKNSIEENMLLMKRIKLLEAELKKCQGKHAKQ